jgi:isopenicillin-N epimerase
MSAPFDLTQDCAAHWDLVNRNPLNHGSFGATPAEILKKLAGREEQFNRDREQFLWHDLNAETLRVRAALAKFVGAAVDDLVLVDNITEGINTVLRSLPLGPGDEVLITSHIYSPFPAPLGDLAAWRSFTVKTAEIPYPPRSDDDIINPILAAVTKKTKLAIVDHITSPTALIFPVKKIVAALAARGVDCFIDGAHAPGQIPVNAADIGAAYYSANNHKWLCAPVSSGFLHVRADRQADIVPVVASAPGHRGAKFAERFSWQGTKDMIPRMLVPETIEFMGKLHPQGWPGIMARNHALAVAARDLLTGALGIPAPCPHALFGSMFTLPLGPLQFDAETLKKLQPLSAALQEQTGLRVYSIPFGGQYLLRLSAHLYNNIRHYEALAKVLPAFVASHGSMKMKASMSG